MNDDPWSELRSRILSHPKLDDSDRAEWLALLDTAASQPHGLTRELAELAREMGENVRRFEAGHPQLTATADKIFNFLSRMGI